MFNSNPTYTTVQKHTSTLENFKLHKCSLSLWRNHTSVATTNVMSYNFNDVDVMSANFADENATCAK